MAMTGIINIEMIETAITADTMGAEAMVIDGIPIVVTIVAGAGVTAGAMAVAAGRSGTIIAKCACVAERLRRNTFI
jgi:hypothetical protein